MEGIIIIEPDDELDLPNSCLSTGYHIMNIKHLFNRGLLFKGHIIITEDELDNMPIRVVENDIYPTLCHPSCSYCSILSEFMKHTKKALFYSWYVDEGFELAHEVKINKSWIRILIRIL
jgi:hypothetical protein